MKKLTQLQYKVIFLYSKGLTFKEIDKALATASRGVYSQVVSKDKGRVTRAKLSRLTNIQNYKEDLKKYLDTVKENNKFYRNHIEWIKERYTIDFEIAKDRHRKNYIIDSLDKSFKSYSKYKLTFIRNHLVKIA